MRPLSPQTEIVFHIGTTDQPGPARRSGGHRLGLALVRAKKDRMWNGPATTGRPAERQGPRPQSRDGVLERRNRESVAAPTAASRAAPRSGAPARTLSAAAWSITGDARGRPIALPLFVPFRRARSRPARVRSTMTARSYSAAGTLIADWSRNAYSMRITTFPCACRVSRYRTASTASAKDTMRSI